MHEPAPGRYCCKSRKSDDTKNLAKGQNPARQASIAAGIPVESPAWGVNQLCGSGLRTVALGYQALLNGDSEIVVAGGQESMSMAPHAQYLRGGVKMGPVEFVDTMIKDGLWDAFNGYHMGNTAENVARQYQITRAQQDEFAVASQNKAEAAQKAGKFKDEIVPVTIKSRKGDIIVSDDEYPRHGATIEAMGQAWAGVRERFAPSPPVPPPRPPRRFETNGGATCSAIHPGQIPWRNPWLCRARGRAPRPVH